MLAGAAGGAATRADGLSAPALFLGLEHLAEAANRVHSRWRACSTVAPTMAWSVSK
jgi:hypothetical protein